MIKYFWGIDPGKVSWVMILAPDGTFAGMASIDTTLDVPSVKKLKVMLGKRPPLRVVLEDVGTYMGLTDNGKQKRGGIKATATFLGAVKFWKTWTACMGVPLVMVKPKVWQAPMIGAFQIIKKDGENKKQQNARKRKEIKRRSTLAATQQWPSVDFRIGKTARAKKLDDNKTDAILMAEWLRRETR